jgi:hypothetical protein
MENNLGITLMGGLGNRLFQIASLYGLSKKFNRKMNIRENQENAHSSINYFTNILRNFNLPELQRPFLEIREPGHMPLKMFIHSLPNISVSLIGYFQSEEYFYNYREELIKLLEIEPHIRENILRKYPDIKNRYFIHIRRGDYVNHPLHFINLDNYYQNCIEFIKSKDVEAKFYLLSNDNEYCKTLNWKDCDLIEDYDEVEGLYIMSLCYKGGICPNSSYSWWGSWLNTNNEKIVIFPNKWFNNNWDCDIGFKGAYLCHLNSFDFFRKN